MKSESRVIRYMLSVFKKTVTRGILEQRFLNILASGALFKIQLRSRCAREHH